MKSGLYIHIPFCKNKCPYCDFYSVKYNEDDAKRYVDEVIECIGDYNGCFDTIYFGGGTPSIIPPEFIGKIISASRKQFAIDDDCEITIECNPSKDLRDNFKLYKSYGINRISLGMQSAVDRERFALGRSAGRTQVEKAISDARSAGITNISLDLMLGTPHQTEQSLNESLDFIIESGVPHVSAYMLKIEQGTRFYDIKDKLELPNEDAVANIYLKTVETLERFGLKQYEISNFAKPGYESLHNLKYWELAPYLGIGKSAHSYYGGKRFYYDRNFCRKDDGEGGTDEEALMLGLRLTKGVNSSLIKKDVTPYINMGLMTQYNGLTALTPRGMLVSNTIISQLL